MRSLQVGPLNVHYENGFLRYIRHGETEVLRMIYFALRDEGWTTLPMTIRNEKVEAKSSSFQVEYNCYHQKDNETVFNWNVKIDGNSDGSVIFQINGEAAKDIL